MQLAHIEEHEWVNRARHVIDRNAAAVLATQRRIDERFVALARALLACRGKILVTGRAAAPGEPHA